MNYAHGIIIGFILFALYILYFVYQSFNERIELVSEDYYNQEVAYQDRIDAEENARMHLDAVSVMVTDSGVDIRVPIEVAKGMPVSVVFFRPSDTRLDFGISLLPEQGGEVLVPMDRFSAGRYEVHLSWQAEGKNYFIKKDIHL